MIVEETQELSIETLENLDIQQQVEEGQNLSIENLDVGGSLDGVVGCNIPPLKPASGEELEEGGSIEVYEDSSAKSAHNLAAEVDLQKNSDVLEENFSDGDGKLVAQEILISNNNENIAAELTSFDIQFCTSRISQGKALITLASLKKHIKDDFTLQVNKKIIAREGKILIDKGSCFEFNLHLEDFEMVQDISKMDMFQASSYGVLEDGLRRCGMEITDYIYKKTINISMQKNTFGNIIRNFSLNNQFEGDFLYCQKLTNFLGLEGAYVDIL